MYDRSGPLLREPCEFGAEAVDSSERGADGRPAADSSTRDASALRPRWGRDDPASDESRVLRGGSFASLTAGHLRCARRSASRPGRRSSHIGFRVARPADDRKDDA